MTETLALELALVLAFIILIISMYTLIEEYRKDAKQLRDAKGRFKKKP